MEMKNSIKYGSKQIDFNLKFSNRKTMGIKVFPDSSVEVVSPNNSDIVTIKDRVKSKASWIVKQQDFFLSFRPITPPRKYISGETHLYLGKQFRLKIIESEFNTVKLKSGYLKIYTSIPNNKKAVQRLLYKWYEEKASLHFNTLFTKCVKGFSTFHDYNPQLKFRLMEKRWGSCSRNGIIHLNTELIKARKEYIEYVIIHELCHLIHYNHSSDFYNLLDNLYPDWKKTKYKLELLMV